MFRRLVTLVMVMTIALCPVALDVCQVACAAHTHGVAVTSASAEHHHHAEPANAMAAHHQGHHAALEAGTAPRIPAYAAATAPRIACTMRGVPQGCVHGEDLPALVGTNLQVPLAPAAVVPAQFELAGLTSGTRLFVDTTSVVHSPQPILTTQLRV